jgi:tubulin beta
MMVGYEGNGEMSYRKLVENLVLWPKLSLVELGFAPLTCRCLCNKSKTEEEMVTDLLNRQLSLCRAEIPTGKFTSAFLLFRGNARELPLNIPPLADFQVKWSFPWLPDSLKTAYSSLRPRGLKMSIGLIGGHTGVAEVLGETLRQGREMYDRRAFLHWYTAQGMETERLEEALKEGEDLAEEYRKLEREA